MKEIHIDERRKVVIPGNSAQTVQFATDDWISIAKNSIEKKGFFAVALSGGSTPKAIYQQLSKSAKDKIDWKKVFLFWSDERCAPPTDPESNYHMAMSEGGLDKLGIPSSQIFRMKAEDFLSEHALEYEKDILHVLGALPFDLMMLGLGEDGHTASLFPRTAALNETTHLVTGNFIPQKNVHRMTMTYRCINNSKNIRFYVAGSGKADILKEVLQGPYNPIQYPSQKVGLKSHIAIYIADEAATSQLASS